MSPTRCMADVTQWTYIQHILVIHSTYFGHTIGNTENCHPSMRHDKHSCLKIRLYQCQAQWHTEILLTDISQDWPRLKARLIRGESANTSQSDCGADTLLTAVWAILFMHIYQAFMWVGPVFEDTAGHLISVRRDVVRSIAANKYGIMCHYLFASSPRPMPPHCKYAAITARWHLTVHFAEWLVGA